MSDAEARRIYQAAEIGGQITRGRRPAVVVVDLQRGFTDAGSPVGFDMTAAVTATRRLVDAARACDVPVLFTVIAYGDDAEAGVWPEKMPGITALRLGSPYAELDARLAQRPGEPVIVKHGASALHGTNVSAILTSRGVDTVVVAGATTSGCVRATVVDLMQDGFRVLVAADACGDRAAAPHESNLFDMAAKYADVIDVDDAVGYLTTRSTEGIAR